MSFLRPLLGPFLVLLLNDKRMGVCCVWTHVCTVTSSWGMPQGVLFIIFIIIFFFMKKPLMFQGFLFWRLIRQCNGSVLEDLYNWMLRKCNVSARDAGHSGGRVTDISLSNILFLHLKRLIVISDPALLKLVLLFRYRFY